MRHCHVFRPLRLLPSLYIRPFIASSTVIRSTRPGHAVRALSVPEIKCKVSLSVILFLKQDARGARKLPRCHLFDPMDIS